MSSIKQKDYLKKYLSIGKDRKEKKKRKKSIKSNTAPSRLTIIDDNADTFNTAVKEDLLEDEDAPQIVAVIDERPPSLQIDEKSKTNLWIPIGGVKEELSSNSIDKRDDVDDLSPPRSKFKLALKRNSEISPPRKKSSNTRDEHKKNINEVITVKTEYVSPPREEHYSSHPRKLDRKKSSKHGSSDDITPPRKVICKEEKIDDDFSPPRRRCEVIETPNVMHRQKSDDDFSPPRKRREVTPPKKSHRKKSSRWESTNNDESSLKHESNKKGDRRLAENHTDNDTSPPRKRSRTTPEKMMKTLDGKTAGLQNAKQLAKETSLHKEKELDMLNKMSSSVSGANASTIIRDKKTGRVRNFEEEAARELEKKKNENVNKEKYSRWGRGLKQVEDATKRKEEELNEMSKPLARYANDDDLERYLKEQERDGDPMLAYIRKKKKKMDVDQGKPIKPEYMGEFMPNRFGIKPGHRWDGVDRSNGYERKWFDNQNSKLAELEESYKWSTEDM